MYVCHGFALVSLRIRVTPVQPPFSGQMPRVLHRSGVCNYGRKCQIFLVFLLENSVEALAKYTVGTMLGISGRGGLL